MLPSTQFIENPGRIPMNFRALVLGTLVATPAFAQQDSVQTKLYLGKTVVSFEGEAAEALYESMREVAETTSALGWMRLGKNVGCLKSFNVPYSYNCQVGMNSDGSSLTQAEIEKLYDANSGTE
jgi:hypothetical protein